MRCVIAGALLCLAMPAVAASQIDETNKTLGSTNGRFWIGLDRVQKVGYVLGVMETANYAAAQVIIKFPCAAKSEQDELLTVPGNLTFGEIADELDLIYGSPTSRQIPIVWLFSYIKEKATGSSAAALEAHLQRDLRIIAIMAAAANAKQ